MVSIKQEKQSVSVDSSDEISVGDEKGTKEKQNYNQTLMTTIEDRKCFANLPNIRADDFMSPSIDETNKFAFPIFESNSDDESYEVAQEDTFTEE